MSDNEVVYQQMIDALLKSDVDRFETLLKKGANPNIIFERSLYSILFSAAGYGNEAIVKLLLDHGAEVDQGSRGGSTPLIEAASKGYLNIAKLLVSAGADVNASNRMGVTALLEAVTSRKVEMVQWLVSKGAHPEGKNLEGDISPLAYVVSKLESDDSFYRDNPQLKTIAGYLQSAKIARDNQKTLSSLPGEDTKKTARRI